jgi:hypothetical protein
VRRLLVVIAVIAAVLGGGVDEAKASLDDGAVVYGDFDGDSVPETVASEPTHDNVRGRVYIQNASGSVFELHRGLTEVLGSSSPWQRFGSSLAVGDFDGDGYDDLAVGAPSASDAATRAGSVHVFYGSSSGLSLTGDQLWHQDSTGILGVAEQDDFFGEVLATGDFDCDGYDDLAIGAPAEDLDGKTNAGVVHVLYGSSSGLSSTNNEWYQGHNGIGGATEGNDRFGEALATGNFNGDTDSGHDCDDLAIGVPFEDVGALTDAGVLYVVDGGTGGLSTSSSLTIDQDVSGVVDDVEAFDYFALRLVAADADGDEFTDLHVTVVDACGSGGGWGRHTFFGSSSGLADNELLCDLFGCGFEDPAYSCPSTHPPVHATNGDDAVRFMFGNDVAYGKNGHDAMVGSIGGDILFGNAGNDDLDGGAGADILLGGFGDDSFVIDLDCAVQAGDIIDGGIGTDTIYSHRSQSELAAMGLLIRDIENFETIAENPHPYGENGCERFSFFTGTPLATSIQLGWQELPSPSSTYSTTTGVLHLTVDNVATVSRTFEIASTIQARGFVSSQTLAPVTLAASGNTTVAVDLADFIPAGVDPETIPTEYFELPTSATIHAVASVVVGGNVVETAQAPIIYGHLEDDGETAVLYGDEARQTTYNNGDLENLTVSGPTTWVSGITRVYGSRG